MSAIRIAVTGPDGAGKTTLIQAAVAALAARHGPGTAASVGVWDALPLPGEAARAYLGAIGPHARALLLLHAVARSLEVGERSGARILLLDGYWYKYAVSELEHGAPAAVFQGCAAFPRPDLTFALDLPVAEALRRKGEVTAYERGFGAEREAFLAFQGRLRERWAAMEREAGPWIHLSALDPPEALVARVVSEVEALLARQSAP